MGISRGAVRLGVDRFSYPLYFQELKAKKDKTVILVTHSLPEVEQFCDRVFVMDQGKVITSATPAEAIRQYQGITH